MRILYNIPVEKPQRKRLLGKRRRRWEDNIKMEINITGLENVE
jgi:hypothetical protein